MERHALLFRVRPGSETAVAELLSGYRRPATEIDADARLLGTTVLMHGTTVVRYLEIEGNLPKVAAHLARQPEVQAVERALNPHLELPRDLTDPQSARAFLGRSAMTLLTHRGAPVHPPGVTVTRHALLYPLRPGTGDAADPVFLAGGDPPPQAGGTRLLSTTVFRRGDSVVRLFEIAGVLDEAIGHLVRAAELQQAGRRLATFLAEGTDIRDEHGLQRFFCNQLMTVVTDRRVAQAA